MTFCSALLAIAFLTTQTPQPAPPMSVVIAPSEVKEDILKQLWAAKDANEVARKNGFSFRIKDETGFFVQSGLMLGTRVRDTELLLDATLKSVESKDKGIVDPSKLTGDERGAIQRLMAGYSPYLPKDLRGKAAAGDLSFAIEPNVFTRATMGSRTIAFAGSLSKGGQRERITNVPDPSAPEVDLDPSLLDSTAPGGKLVWRFSPKFRRQSNRLAAMKAGAELLYAAGEDLARLDEKWRSLSSALADAYAEQIGTLPDEANTFSKLGPLMQQHLMVPFSGSFASHGFNSRLEAETWLQGATLRDSQVLLFVAVGVKDQDGRTSRISFPLIHP